MKKQTQCENIRVQAERDVLTGRFKVLHGRSSDKSAGSTYNAWFAMRQRCLYVKHKSYAQYGGSGVTVCQRWDYFSAFLQDMGERPAGTSIGRIDNAKGYEPGNCEWHTAKQQARNRRSNRIISAFGESKTIAEWAEDRGIRQDTLTHRLNHGWSVVDALTRKVATRPRRTPSGKRVVLYELVKA